MSKRPQTEIAVLGALSVAPMTGYAVRAAITETLGHFWSESFGQIYPTLARLEQDGFIRRSGEGRTSGSTFELTRSGTARLRMLLREPVEPAPPRNGLLLRLFFGRLLGGDECRRLLEETLVTAEASLRTFADLQRTTEDEDDANTAYFLVTIAAGRHGAQAQADWARESLGILERYGV